MILSIDIGIKNLSFCIMSCTDKKVISTYKIHLWNVYNTLEDYHKCKFLTKSGKICDKKCGYKHLNDDKEIIYSCKLHFPKVLLPLKRCNNFKPKLVKNYLLQDLAKIIINKLNLVYNENMELFNGLSDVIIELQPTINPSMKFVSHLIYGKLVELYINRTTTVKFVRASQKLKAYTGPEITCKLKGKYAQRKWLSIQYTKYFLENKFNNDEMNNWLNDFLNCGKCDDRSDTFLMAINCLYGMPKTKRQY